ncbi:extracellular solute-binding protein [Paenibacillus sp. 2KB_20]|uniref:extracellular solute-binding protein n=1 Tax=Paenibacillus sp. 2KB_20 TaxID=3232977 RepID=UPI003F98CCA7
MVKRSIKFLNRLLLVILSVALIGNPVLPGNAQGDPKIAESSSPDTRTQDFSSHEPYFYTISKEWEQKKVKVGAKEALIDAKSYHAKSDDAVVSVGSYEGEHDVLLWSQPKGWVEYKVNVDQEGLYELATDYHPFLSKDGLGRQSVIMSVQINGEYPFREAHSVSLERRFSEVRPEKYDDEGNQIRSLIDEEVGWKTTSFRDSEGSYSKPLQWHLNKGENTIRIETIRQSVALKSFRLQVPKDIANYEDVRKTYPTHAASGSKEAIVIEGEQFSLKNSSSIQTQYDRSPLSEPKSLDLVRFNTLGGTGWNKGGQAVTWDFEVPEDGVYHLTFRVKQNLRKNATVFRNIYIDGEIPFNEMKNVPFPYDSDWKKVSLANTDGELFDFYFTKGKHSLKMEATVEPYIPVIADIDQMSKELRDVSRELRIATGNSTDAYRVWNIEKDIPGMTKRLEVLRDSFNKLTDEMLAINKVRDNVSQSFKSSVRDLEDLLKDPNEIPYSQLTIGTMQEKIEAQRVDLMNTPLQIDRIYVAAPDTKLPRIEANFFEKLWNSIVTLFYSFSSKNQLDRNAEDELNIWMFKGRDYVDELQQLANERFTPEHGIKVNINLVQSADLVVLGKAAGILPDIAIGVPSASIFDYALRNAIYDFTKFPDSEELLDQFHPGIMQPYRYDSGVYGIPETNNFNIMFYRKDIMNQLGLSVPDTWDDVYKILPTLLQNESNFYIPPDNFSYLFFQNNVELYSKDGLTSALNEPKAFEAFKEWTEMFNVYGMERQVNSFYQQFRDGTMPIGISDFNTYMQLLVAAPEIMNEWAIAPIPGTKQADGTIARWAAGGAPTANILFNDTPKEKRDLAWDFVKWYMSEDIQTEFGLNLEQYRGETFRWNSANVDAFANMPWKQDDLSVILDQWQWMQEWPNVPGGYMTARELGFAWNNAAIDQVNPRIALEKAVKEINREMKRKQQEFNYIDENGQVLKKLDLIRITEPWKGAILNDR